MNPDERQAVRGEIRRILWIWLALLALLALTLGSALVRLGAWNSAANLLIAAAKALLVGYFFMRLRESPGIVRLCVAVALSTLALLFAIGAADYASRAFYPAPWQAPGAS